MQNSHAKNNSKQSWRPPKLRSLKANKSRLNVAHVICTKSIELTHLPVHNSGKVTCCLCCTRDSLDECINDL